MLTLPIRLFLACFALGFLGFVAVGAGDTTTSTGESCEYPADTGDSFEDLRVDGECSELNASRTTRSLLFLGGGAAVGGAAAFVASHRREDVIS